MQELDYKDWSDLRLANKYHLSESEDERMKIIMVFRERLELKSYQSNDFVEARMKEVIMKSKLSKPQYENLIYGISVLSIVLLFSAITILVLISFFDYTFPPSLSVIIIATLLINEYVYSCYSGVVRAKLMEFNKIENPISFGIIRNLYLFGGIFLYGLVLIF